MGEGEMMESFGTHQIIPGPESDAELRTALDRCKDLEGQVGTLRGALHAIAHMSSVSADALRSIAAAVLRS
jgi:hypothetical protein